MRHLQLRRLFHPALAATAEGRRSATMVWVATFLGVHVLLAQVLVVGLSGRTGRMTLALVFLPVSVVPFFLLRLCKTTAPAAHLMAVISTGLVAIALAGEDRLYPGTVAWLGVVCATLIVARGARAGLVWLGVHVVLVLGIFALRRAGVFTVWLVPSDTMSVVRGVGLVVSYVVLAVLFERSRAVAMLDSQRLAESKTHFLANVSHELRTPMHGVLGLTELLLHSKLEPTQREQLELVQRSARGLVSLLNDLLDMSKVEAGKMQLDLVDFDVRRLLEDCRALHEPAARMRGLRFALELEPSLPEAVHGDMLRLRQVLDNLVNNAIKFTPRGSVRLRVINQGERFSFEVIDSGIGISAEAVPRLFTAFSQAEAGTTRRFGGTGLGLALCRELVNLMGGSLKVESAEGLGTTLSFTIALTPSLGALVASPPQPVDLAPRSRLPVLVVDDNPINLRVACGLVEKAGYTCLTANDGQQALDIVRRHDVYLVLMDCHMPVMDGFEATEKIRAIDGEQSFVPIIALTASAMPEELARCREAGMNDCLVKPITLLQIQQTLQQAAVLRGHALT